MNVIKELKNNKSAFGLMSEEMQAKAKEFDLSGFLALVETGDESLCGWIECSNSDTFELLSTYRLRPDYEEKDSVVKWEVYFCEKDFALKFRGNLAENFLHVAVDCKGFIGFLYEDGKVTAGPRKYKSKANDMYYDYLPVRWHEAGTAEVLTPTHVLFRSDK